MKTLKPGILSSLFLPALGVAVAASVALADARAQSWPREPIKVIVPISAGSAADVVPRIVFQEISARIGQPVIVENRPGAGGMIGASAVAKADPDGHTLLAMSASYTILPAVHSNLPYNAKADLQPVVAFGNIPNALVVAPSKGYRTLHDLVAAAKAKPGQLNYGSVGNGTALHLNAERFRLSAGIEVQHVAIKGAPELATEVLTGRLDFSFLPLLDHPLGHLSGRLAPHLQALPVWASMLEHDNAFGHLLWSEVRVALCRHDDRLFPECHQAVELGRRDWLGHERCVELIRENCCRKLSGVPGAQLQANVGVPPAVSGQRTWKAHRGGTFHGTQPKEPARRAVLNGSTSAFGEHEDLLCILKERSASWRQLHALAFAEEELGPKVVLQLPDACRHIGLDTMQPPCRARHTAFPYDGQEDAKFSEIHSSLLKIISIIIIHFSEHSAIAIYSVHRNSHSSQDHVTMTPESIARVRETWLLVAPIADTAADLFYQRLFALDPRLRLLFGSTDWAAQRRKLVHALNLAVASLDKIEETAPTLEALGSRHASYGVQDSHYDTVGEALIATLEQGLGEAWTAEAAAAWKEAYDIVAGAMRRAPARAVSSSATA